MGRFGFLKLMWLALLFSDGRQFPVAFTSPPQFFRPTLARGCSSEPDEPSLDMDVLQQRMNRQNDQYARLLVEQLKYSSEEINVPESVHIILFKPGTEQQHVHTLEFPVGSGNNMILAFESGADCVSFARDLQDLEFGQPHPEETVFDPFREYCEMTGASLVIVPERFGLSPPQLNSNDIEESEADDDWIEEADDSREGDNGEEMDAWG